MPGSEDQIRRTMLSVRDVMRRASALSAASLLGSAVAILVSFLVARWLGPRDFGRAQFVLLFYVYGALLQTGIFAGSVRAFIHHWNRNEPDQAVRDQNVGFSFETWASFVPGLLLLISGFFINDPIRRTGFFLAPIAVVAASVTGFFAALYSARHRFDLVARLSAFRSMVAGAATLLGVLAIGPYAVFLMPIIADLATAGLYGRSRPPLGLRVSLDWDSARPLLKAGFPLGAAAFVYWAYRLVGSTSVALWGDARVFGIYAFAAAPITILSRMLASVHAVSTPAVWGEMAVDEGGGHWVRGGERLTLALAFIAAVVTNLSQAGFAPLVGIITPGFSQAIPLFDVLVLNVFLLSVGFFPSLVLDSTAVNKQVRHLTIWIFGLALNAIANAVVLAAGWGVMAVAWNDIWVQCLVVAAIFKTAEPYMGQTLRRAYLYGTLLLVGLLTAANGVVLHAFEMQGGTRDALAQLAIRVLAVLLVWALALVAFRSVMNRRTTLHWPSAS